MTLTQWMQTAAEITAGDRQRDYGRRKHESLFHFNIEIEEKVVQEYISGLSLPKLAKQHKCSVCCIDGILRRHNIPKRRCGKPSVDVWHEAFSTLVPESMYWAGFLMGDGCVTDDGYICLGLQERDQEHIAKFKNYVRSSHKTHIHKPRKGRETPLHEVRFVSRQMAVDLGHLGITPRKTYTAEASQEVVGSRDFWRGMIDSDGSLGSSNGFPELMLCGMYHVVYQFHDYVLASGIHTKASVTEHSKSGIKRFRLVGSPAISVVKLLYQKGDIALDRKYQKAMEWTNGQ